LNRRILVNKAQQCRTPVCSSEALVTISNLTVRLQRLGLLESQVGLTPFTAPKHG
jgi:hypothetical protein